ncbi:MAG: type III secretion system export apparatus subunit SctU [Puniceicoccales bacterium]|jgi:type III secretion protein U|nr:type III secretion system export apparatus subunit SctU [Puniceicoccales bacterium]
MSSEKTEMPTPKRLRDARKKGQVSKSTDVNSTALLIGIFSYIGAGWVRHVRIMEDMIALPIVYVAEDFRMAYANVVAGIFIQAIKIIIPAIGICILMAIIANCSQIGFLLSFDPVKPDIKKINPMEKIKQIFSKKNLFEFLKSSFKILFLGILIYLVIKNVMRDLLLLPFNGLQGTVNILGPIMRRFSYNVIFAYVTVACIDFVFQKRDFMNKMKMTKDEVKREYKEMEGDPQIKGKRRQLHREMVEQDAPRKTKQSSALVTNPEHIAVALYYDIKSRGTTLPIILATGHGAVAEEMIRVARENNIPIMRNVPLAHSLMDVGDVMTFIPTELIEPVAEVLRWVYEMRGQHERGIGLEGEAW